MSEIIEIDSSKRDYLRVISYLLDGRSELLAEDCSGCGDG
jgi:hypothetical protein